MLDPFLRLAQAETQLGLDPGIGRLIRKRFRYLEEGVRRVEKASEIPYPPFYVEPVLPVATSSVELGQIGILYARTLPLETASRLEIWIQFSAPLVAFASRWTVHAVAAHEFMHYVELVRRFTRMDTTSDEVATTLFEAQYADREDLFDPNALLQDKALVRLVGKKFPGGLVDEKLHAKTVSQWLEKGRPAARLPPESNVVKIKVSSLLNTSFDPLLRAKLIALEPARP